MFVSRLLRLFNRVLASWFIQEQKSQGIPGAVGTTSVAFAGGRRVVEESSHGAWRWGLSPGPESPPGFCRRQGPALPLHGIINILTRVLMEAACKTFPCFTLARGC